MMAVDTTALDDILSFIKTNWPDLVIDPKRIQGFYDEIESGDGRDAEKIRLDIITHIITQDRIKEYVRGEFTSRDKTIATGDETEDERLDRIVREIMGGERTFKNVGEVLEGKVIDKKGTLAPEDVGPPSIPRGARLVRVGKDYRVIWDLPEDIGTVWYSISTTQLSQIYGDNWEGDVSEVYSNAGSFEAKYGDMDWGNIAEISKTSEDPWQDMYDRILNTFGFVAGMDNPEVRNLIIQAYFEDWSSAEFLALYKQTDYFNSVTDLQREWVTTSDAEKETLIRSKASELVNLYKNHYGEDPEGGIDNPEILAAAKAIASGAMDIGEWDYNTRKDAEAIETSPAARALIDEEQARGEQESSTENLADFAADEWRRWLGGSVPMPEGFADEWGNWLYLNQKSEADLESHLKSLGSTYYPDKDRETTWSDWAAIPKSYIQNLLELPIVDDDDGLLDNILTSGAAGYDMRVLIKSDPRYLETKGALSDVSSKVSDLGKMMGFTPGGDI